LLLNIKYNREGFWKHSIEKKNYFSLDLESLSSSTDLQKGEL